METFVLISCQVINNCQHVGFFLRLCSFLLSSVYMIYEGGLKYDKENVIFLKNKIQR